MVKTLAFKAGVWVQSLVGALILSIFNAEHIVVHKGKGFATW